MRGHSVVVMISERVIRHGAIVLRPERLRPALAIEKASARIFISLLCRYVSVAADRAINNRRVIKSAQSPGEIDCSLARCNFFNIRHSIATALRMRCCEYEDMLTNTGRAWRRQRLPNQMRPAK